MGSYISMEGIKMNMKFYKDKDNIVYSLYDDGVEPKKWLNVDATEISRNEALKLLKPIMTREQLVVQAEYEKQSRVTEANQKTQLWQTQLMLDIITDEDKASLTEWMLYVQKVQAVDTSAAPDILWPEKPE
ncbi:TPA: tail fiber assembly protein [Morganella morganii]|nr:tail fiber assembly protein [Morganella morganii]EKU5690032.1 tail fiber assembly protein [Morganella morganii]HCD1105736.1 tail fiber assembly protein [Morganella morganii]